MDKNSQGSPLLVAESELQIISQDILLIIDTKGIIVDVNTTAVRVFGKDRDDLTGTQFSDYFVNPVKANNAVKQVLETGEVRDNELVILTGEGDNVIIVFNMSPYKDQAGKIVGVFATGHDITQRKWKELELHYLQRYNRGLIEVSLDPLVTFDHKGIIMDVNEATIKATGRSREELIGTPFADYFTEPDKAYKGAMQTFKTGEVRDYELVMKAKDGVETIVAYNASVYKDQTGQVVGAFAAARDVSLQKKAEHELQETVNRLEAYTTRINSLMVSMLDQITEEKTKGVILDISGLPADVEVIEPLVKIAQFARDIGATCVVTGIKQEAVQRLIDAGANLAPITTERSLVDGLRYTIAMVEEES